MDTQWGQEAQWQGCITRPPSAPPPMVDISAMIPSRQCSELKKWSSAKQRKRSSAKIHMNNTQVSRAEQLGHTS